MRILHTSDWHLGRDFYGYSLETFQDAFLETLFTQLKETKPDALLISGDILDKPNPRDEDLDRLSDFLNRARRHTHIVLIAGNHDGASRLGFAKGFTLPEVNLFTKASQVGLAVEIPDRNGELAGLVYPIPYLYPYQDRTELSTWKDTEGKPQLDAYLLQAHEIEREKTANSLDLNLKLPGKPEVLFAAALRRIGQDISRRGKSVPVVGMAHDFLTDLREGEEPQPLGTLYPIPVSLLKDLGGSVEPGEGIDYLALGHIHSAFPVDGSPVPAWYAGSPLPYRVSEGNHKCTLLVDLDQEHRVKVKRLPLDLPYQVKELSGSFLELADPQNPDFLPYHDSFCKILLSESTLPLGAYGKLKAIFPRMVKLELTGVRRNSTVTDTVLEEISELDFAKNFLAEVGAKPQLTDLIAEIYEAALREVTK